MLTEKIALHDSAVMMAPPTKAPRVVLRPHIAEMPPRYLPLSSGVVISDVIMRTTEPTA